MDLNRGNSAERGQQLPLLARMALTQSLVTQLQLMPLQLHRPSPNLLNRHGLPGDRVHKSRNVS